MAHRRIDLDDRGRDYVLEHLRNVNYLCRQLAAVVERVDGRTYTLVPDDADVAHIYDFERGGLLRENLDPSRAIYLGPGQGVLMPVADLASLRGGLILQTLNAHPGGVCLCDDVNPTWNSAVALSTPDAFGVGDETYHLLTAASGLETIVDTISFTDAVWHGVAAICRSGLQPSPDRSVEPEALAECAQSVVQLSCTAYDREGFVVWEAIAAGKKPGPSPARG